MKINRIRTILSAIDRGITLIDTAPVYGFGKSEEIVGKALEWAGVRQRVLLATRSGSTGRTASRFATPPGLESSPRSKLRLKGQTDFIDIYQVHWPDR